MEKERGRKAGAKRKGRGCRLAGAKNKGGKPHWKAAAAKERGLAPPCSDAYWTPGWKFAVCAIVLLCAAFALRLGAGEPEVHFQVAGSSAAGESPEGCMHERGDAFATRDALMMFVPHWGHSAVYASFDGLGRADRLSFEFSEPALNITRIAVNGKEACAPCRQGEKYPIAADGRIDVTAWASESDFEPPAGRSASFISPSVRAHTDGRLVIRLGGGWRSGDNAAVASSFYGVDSPFHIDKIGVLAGYLRRGQWPWANYGFVPVAPAAAANFATGITSQYAYKLYEIALFFVPLAVFYMFARKLRGGGAAAFLFSSLTYLFMPTTGMINGGGPDLFFYGMTAHTLASHLSLFFFYFAYEFIAERRNCSLAAAIAFFAAAFVCNPRIALALWLYLGVLAAYALVCKSARRALALCAACAAFCVWGYLMLIAPISLSAYGALQGVDVWGSMQSIYNFIQTGYAIIPVLFAIGIWGAYERREALPLLLAGAAAIVYVFVTSPGLNALFPFVDGVRFMPSAFLPVFFVCGIGLDTVWRQCRLLVRHLGNATGLPADDAAIAFALALGLPLAIVLCVSADSAALQYSNVRIDLEVASAYHSLEKAHRVVGDADAVYLSRWDISQYPIYEGFFGNLAWVGYQNPRQLEQRMREEGASYAMLGGYRGVSGNESRRVWQDYAEISQSGLFTEINVGQGTRLFALHGIAPKPDVETGSAVVRSSQVLEDRAAFVGVCNDGPCKIIVHKPLAPFLSCKGGCHAKANATDTVIGGIGAGPFAVEVEPAHPEFELPALLLFAAVAGAALFLASPHNKTIAV